MPISKEEFVKRARAQSAEPGDYFDWVAGMVENKPGIGITDRGAYSHKQWNALVSAKEQLINPWERY